RLGRGDFSTREFGMNRADVAGRGWAARIMTRYPPVPNLQRLTQADGVRVARRLLRPPLVRSPAPGRRTSDERRGSPRSGPRPPAGSRAARAPTRPDVGSAGTRRRLLGLRPADRPRGDRP